VLAVTQLFNTPTMIAFPGQTSTSLVTYRAIPRRTLWKNAGQSHENGDAEHAHYRIQERVDQDIS